MGEETPLLRSGKPRHLAHEHLGRFAIYELLTQDQKHPVFTGCQFNGASKDLTENATATTKMETPSPSCSTATS